MSDEIIDLEAAKDRVMGDVDFLKEMLVEFGESIPHSLETLRRAVECGDADLLSKTAHQLKGAASNLSLTQVTAKAAALSEAGKQANLEAAKGAIKELELTFLDLEEYLREKLW